MNDLLDLDYVQQSYLVALLNSSLLMKPNAVKSAALSGFQECLQLSCVQHSFMNRSLSLCNGADKAFAASCYVVSIWCSILIRSSCVVLPLPSPTPTPGTCPLSSSKPCLATVATWLCCKQHIHTYTGGLYLVDSPGGNLLFNGSLRGLHTVLCSLVLGQQRLVVPAQQHSGHLPESCHISLDLQATRLSCPWAAIACCTGTASQSSPS